MPEAKPSAKPSAKPNAKPSAEPPKSQQAAAQDSTLNLTEQLLEDIAAGKYPKIIVMAGAGISVAAGIPDFRSPKTGLYANLQKYDLPYPEAIFDIDYLRENPEPFYTLAREMHPAKFRPTKMHTFIKWISDLGHLKRVYTQNIDTLERSAGVPDELIVEAHGSFATNHCIDCRTVVPNSSFEKTLFETEKIPHCESCEGLVKPDIVFFGEGLPERFFTCIETDFDDVDLAIVAGTSLLVGPFNQLPDMVPKTTPRYLLNMERVGSLGRRKKDKLLLGDLGQLDAIIDRFCSQSPAPAVAVRQTGEEPKPHGANGKSNEARASPDSQESSAPGDDDGAKSDKLTALVDDLKL